MFTFTTALLLVATRGVLAQFTISSIPDSSLQDLVQCKTHTLSWSGGTPPFHIVLNNENDLSDITDTSAQTIDVIVNATEGSIIGYTVVDAENQQLVFASQIVQPSDDSSCLTTAASSLPSATSESLNLTFSTTDVSTTGTSTTAEVAAVTSAQSSVVESTTPQQPKQRSSAAAIIGGIFAGLFVASLIIFALIHSIRRKNRKEVHQLETGYGGYPPYTDSKKSDPFVARGETLITSDRGIVILEPPVQDAKPAFRNQHLSAELFLDRSPRSSITLGEQVPLSRTRKEIFECHSRGSSSSSMRLRAGSISGHSKNSSSSSSNSASESDSSRRTSREFIPPPRLTFTPPLNPSRFRSQHPVPNPPQQVYIRDSPVVANVRESRHGTNMDRSASSSRSSSPAPNEKVDSLQHLVDRLGVEIRTASGAGHRREVSEVDVMTALSTMKQLGKRLSMEKNRARSPAMEYGTPPPTYIL